MFVVFLIMWPGTIMWTEVIFETKSLGVQQKQYYFLFKEKMGEIHWKKRKLLVAQMPIQNHFLFVLFYIPLRTTQQTQ